MKAMWRKKMKSGRLTRNKYNGHYMRDVVGERVFVLTTIRQNGAVHNVTFESQQMAKKLGWVRG